MKILALAVLLLSSRAGGQDLVDNPEFLRWASFRPGAWVAHRLLSSRSGGVKEGEAVVRLLEKKADRILIHQKIALDLKDSATSSEDSREVATKVDREQSLEHLCKKVSEAVEELEVAGRKLRCTRLELLDPDGATIRMWICPEIPGGVVKMERKATPTDPAAYTALLTAWKTEDALPAPAGPPPDLPRGQISHGPFGKCIAWKAGAPPKEQVFVNGVAGAEFQSVSWPPLFGPDGTRFAYFGRKGNDLSLVVDHKVLDTFRWIRPGGPMVRFSPDGTRLAWIRERPDQKVAMTVDGKAGRPFDEIREFSLTKEGLPAYLARDLTASKTFAVVGEEAKEVPADQEPRMGPGGKLALMTRLPGGKVQLTYEGQKSESYAIIQGPVWSSDGIRMLYVGFPTTGECVVVIDGKKGETYRNISLEEIRFSVDGKRYAYLAFPLKGTGMVLVIDGKKVETQGLVRGVAFSPDGRRVGYVQQGATQMAVIDGKKGPEFSGVSSITFSPDSRHVAYIARREDGLPPRGERRLTVVLDGKAGEIFEGIDGIEFDPSGKQIRLLVTVQGRPVLKTLKVE